jgi:hypothetical protein
MCRHGADRWLTSVVGRRQGHDGPPARPPPARTAPRARCGLWARGHAGGHGAPRESGRDLPRAAPVGPASVYTPAWLPGRLPWPRRCGTRGAGCRASAPCECRRGCRCCLRGRRTPACLEGSLGGAAGQWRPSRPACGGRSPAPRVSSRRPQLSRTNDPTDRSRRKRPLTSSSRVVRCSSVTHSSRPSPAGWTPT